MLVVVVVFILSYNSGWDLWDIGGGQVMHGIGCVSGASSRGLFLWIFI